jgi:hypothetical protein
MYYYITQVYLLHKQLPTVFMFHLNYNSAINNR